MAAGATEIAKVLFLFVILFAVSLVFGLRRGRGKPFKDLY